MAKYLGGATVPTPEAGSVVSIALAVTIGLMAIVSCGPRGQNQESVHNARITREDTQLLRAVAEDTLLYGEFGRIPPTIGTNETIVVVPRTLPPDSPYLHEESLLKVIDMEMPMACVRDFVERNRQPSNSLAVTTIASLHVEMGDEDDPRIARPSLRDSHALFHIGFRQKYPQAKGFIQFWLPGYSKDLTSAIVVFTIFPTPHGALGASLLEKRQNNWIVVRRYIAYFM